MAILSLCVALSVAISLLLRAPWERSDRKGLLVVVILGLIMLHVVVEVAHVEVIKVRLVVIKQLQVVLRLIQVA